MDEFAAAYFAAKEKAAGSQSKWEKLHAELYRLLSPAVARFTPLLESEDEDDQETAEGFRADLNDYVRKYGFLAQIVPYRDAELERLHLYGRYLLNRLPRRADGGVDIGEVDLSHLRVEKTGEYDVSLTAEGPTTMHGFGDGSGGAKEAEKSLLSELIEKFNERSAPSSPSRTSSARSTRPRPTRRCGRRPSSTTRTTSATSSTGSSPTRWPTTSTPPPAWAASTSAPTRASGPTWTAAHAGRRGG